MQYEWCLISEIIGSGISDTMVCDNNQLANKDTKCILDFDDFGEIKGCRDLSHIETCGMFSYLLIQ